MSKMGARERFRRRARLSRSSKEPAILPNPDAWIIVAVWIIGLGLIALIRAWKKRNEMPRR